MCLQENVALTQVMMGNTVAGGRHVTSFFYKYVTNLSVNELFIPVIARCLILKFYPHLYFVNLIVVLCLYYFLYLIEKGKTGNCFLSQFFSIINVALRAEILIRTIQMETTFYCNCKDTLATVKYDYDNN